MYPCEQLCDSLTKSFEFGRKHANQVIVEFANYLKIKNRNLLLQLANSIKSENEDPMSLLRTIFLANPSVPLSCTNKFYEILKKHNYREEDEFLECISYIAKHCDSNLDLSFWKRCRWIKEITYDEKSKMYTIVTTKGNFTFLPISYMFQREIELIKLNAKSLQSSTSNASMRGYNVESIENFDYQCHFVSYEFSKLHPEFYAVTAICPHCFPNTYWLHSYDISYDGSYVTDIANGFVMPIDDFERLIQPKILDKTLGEDIPIRLQQIKNDTSWPFFRNTNEVPLKTLAFYQFDSLSEEERQKIFMYDEIDCYNLK